MDKALKELPQVVIVIIRHEDLFWIHQRAASKRVYPNLWGVGIGGKVDAGETTLEAAARELFEESGLGNPPQYCFDFQWRSEAENYRGHLYVINLDIQQKESMQPCAREFEQFQWATKAEIERKKISGQLCPDTEYFWTLFSVTAGPIAWE